MAQLLTDRSTGQVYNVPLLSPPYCGMYVIYVANAYLEPCERSMMEIFQKYV